MANGIMSDWTVATGHRYWIGLALTNEVVAVGAGKYSARSPTQQRYAYRTQI